MGTSLPYFERQHLREPALPNTALPEGEPAASGATRSVADATFRQPDATVGRRIYVNEESFMSLAQASKEAALATFQLMGQTSVESLVSHEVATQGVICEGVDEEQARQIQEKLRRSWRRRPSDLLRHVGHRPQGKGVDRGPIEPLLEADECIAASCYFSSYYTFATSQIAAQRMFGDVRSIHEVKKQQKAKVAYADLTLVSGPRLVLLSGLAPVREARVEESPLARSTALRLKEAVYDETRQLFTRFLSSLRSMLSESLLHSLSAIPDRVFSRGVLRIAEGPVDGPTCSC